MSKFDEMYGHLKNRNQLVKSDKKVIPAYGKGSRFPYNARDVFAAIGITGDFTTRFKDHINRFDAKAEEDYLLLVNKEQSSTSRGTKTVHEYYLTEELALQIASTSRKPQAVEFAKHIVNQLQATRAALEELEQKKYVRDRSKDARNVFTDSIKRCIPNATPTDYIQNTYAMKAYAGIACNKKKDDLTDPETRKIMIAELTASLHIDSLPAGDVEGVHAAVKAGGQQVANIPSGKCDLFYDKNYPSRDSLRGKIVELVNIAATLKGEKHETVWFNIYRTIFEYFAIDVYYLYEKVRKTNKKISKLDIIVDYGVPQNSHPELSGTSLTLGEWVLEHMSRFYTKHYNPNALIEYDKQNPQITRPILRRKAVRIPINTPSSANEVN